LTCIFSNSQVCQTILFNIDPVKEAVPYIVASTNDDMTRRNAYSRPLSGIKDFRKMLSSGQQNSVLEGGLKDRNILVSAFDMVVKK
jgi:hypothetical protein